MCLILDRLPIAVWPTPVAHWRAALAPRQPRGPMRRRIRPPARPVAVLQAAMAQWSQTAHQAPHCLQDGPVHCVLRKLCTDTASNETSGGSSSSDGSMESDSAPSAPPSPRQTSTPCTEEAMSAKVPSGPPSPSLADSSLEVRQILRDQAGHALTRSQYQKQTNAAKQMATVLKQVAQLDINQWLLPEPGEPLPGPSGESNGASRCVQGKQRDSTATSSDKEEPPPPRRKKSHGPKRQCNRETRSFQEKKGNEYTYEL